MQIMIDICKKQKIRKISLQDNSIKIFTGNSIELLYFRTITKGLPYYSKFNFRSPSYSKIIRDNKENYKTNPTFNKKIINEILVSKIDLTKNKILQEKSVSSLANFHGNNVSVLDYMNYLLNLAEQEETIIGIKREEYKIKKKKFNKINIYAWLITLLLKDLYNDTGYVILPDLSFVLYLR